MPTVRRMSREGRRASLLDAAAAILDAGGAGALTFDALARQAGVAPSLPYAYFSSKEELLLLLFDQVIGGLDAEVEAVLADAGADFEVVVRRSLDVWFVAAEEHGRLVGALLGGASVPGLRAAVRRRDASSHDRWHDLVAGRLGLDDQAAHLLAAMLNRTATATIELWLGGAGSRDGLTDAFVAMAHGAAGALRPAT